MPGLLETTQMTWLTEDPTLTIVLGGMLIAVLAIALFKTGRGVFLLAMFSAILVVAALVLVEHLIVTEREKVYQTIFDMAAAFEANDRDAVQTFIAPQSRQISRDADRLLRIVKIEEVNITDGPQISIDQYTSPPTADVELVAIAHGTSSVGGFRPAPTRLYVTLRLQDGRWLVESYRLESPFGQPQD